MPRSVLEQPREVWITLGSSVQSGILIKSKQPTKEKLRVPTIDSIATRFLCLNEHLPQG